MYMSVPSLLRSARPATVDTVDQIRVALLRGERAIWISRAVARPRVATPSVRALSAREVEVLRRVAAGKSNKEIGSEMALSPLTIKSHLARISRKLGTGDRAGLVAIATRAGLL
jgi:DNA-binding NarL/FixJ family response regulator